MMAVVEESRSRAVEESRGRVVAESRGARRVGES
jgi:hypothetical protein